MTLMREKGQIKALPGKQPVLLENLIPGESGGEKAHTCWSDSNWL